MQDLPFLADHTSVSVGWTWYYGGTVPISGGSRCLYRSAPQTLPLFHQESVFPSWQHARRCAILQHSLGSRLDRQPLQETSNDMIYLYSTHQTIIPVVVDNPPDSSSKVGEDATDRQYKQSTKGIWVQATLRIDPASTPIMGALE